MNKKPIWYMQTDPRWKNVDYSAAGENTTIGKSGCGPTSAAMLIATLVDKTVSPVVTARWSLGHGFKAPHQGTYYAYFEQQMAEYGIACKRLNISNIYGNPGNALHAEAVKLLEEGWYLIACMGKGLWTSSGHYVVVWGTDGKNMLILDPNSTSEARAMAPISEFAAQVKYYWAIDARAYNQKGGEDEVTQSEFDSMMEDYLKRRADAEPSDWSQEARSWAEGAEIITGDGSGKMQYKSFCTREQMAVFLKRVWDKLKKEG